MSCCLKSHIVVEYLHAEVKKRDTRFESLQKKILAIELLRLLKKVYTYEELSKSLGLPITVINRYVKGHVLPREERAEEIIKFAQKEINLRQEIRRRIKFDENGYFNNMEILSDTHLLKLIAKIVAEKFRKFNITKVLTAAVDGIPLAVHIASELGVDMVFAKKEKEVGVKEFLEEVYAPSFSGMLVSLYLPKGLIKPNDCVLIVDDVMRSGETQKALINLARKAGARVAGVFILIAIGDRWKDKIPADSDFQLEIFLHLKEPYAT